MIDFGKEVIDYITENWDKASEVLFWILKKIVGFGIGTYVSKGITILNKYLKKSTTRIIRRFTSFFHL